MKKYSLLFPLFAMFVSFITCCNLYGDTVTAARAYAPFPIVQTGPAQTYTFTYKSLTNLMSVVARSAVTENSITNIASTMAARSTNALAIALNANINSGDATNALAILNATALWSNELNNAKYVLSNEIANVSIDWSAVSNLIQELNVGVSAETVTNVSMSVTSNAPIVRPQTLFQVPVYSNLTAILNSGLLDYSGAIFMAGDTLGLYIAEGGSLYMIMTGSIE